MKRLVAVLLLLLFLLPVFFIDGSEAGVVDTKILASGENYVHGSLYYGGYLWFSTRTSPTKLIKMVPDTLDYESEIITGENSAEDIEYAENFIWLACRDSGTLIKVDPDNISDWSEVLDFGTNMSQPQSLVYFNNYMYVGGVRKIARVNLTDYSYTTKDYYVDIGAGALHALTNSTTSIWATTNSGGHILQIDPDDITNYNHTTIGSYSISDDITYHDGNLYFGIESSPYRIYKVNGSDISDYSYEQIGTSTCYGVFSYSIYLWASYVGSPGVVRVLDENLTVVDSFSLPTGYDDANEIVFDESDVLYITCWMSPARIVKYQYSFDYDFYLYGAYNEQGTRDGAINVTAYVGNGTQTFELDGTYGLWGTPTLLQFHLGYNQSRTYYIKDDTESIYVFKPTEPYNTYYFTVTDLIGITNGYLETLINVNGTERVVERWKLDVVNDLPFTLSWARTYRVRLVCDQGTYIFGDYVAGAVQTFSFIIIEGMFPRTYPGLDVAVKAKRMNSTWIQANYTDNQEITDWVQVQIKYKSGHSWTTVYTTNNTGDTQQINWYSAVSTTDYVTYVTASREGESKTWSFSCPHVAEGTNPWDGLLDGLGTWPIPAENVIGLFLVLAVLGVFSYLSMPLGCILATIMAGFLTYIRWLNIGWDLIALAFSIGILAAISVAKKEEREI